MCQKLAEQYPLIKGQKICQASLFYQEAGLIPAPFCGCGVCVCICDQGLLLWSGITTAGDRQDKEKPLQNPDCLQTTILNPIPSKHPQDLQRKGSRSRAKDALLFPSAILSVHLPKAQGKVKGTGEERFKHPQHWPSRERLD